MLNRLLATRGFWVVAASFLAFGAANIIRDTYFEHAADRFMLDTAMRLEATKQTREAVSPIMFVRASDQDIAEFGWPLDPETLNASLGLLLANNPAAIGLLSPLNVPLVEQSPNLQDPRVVVANMVREQHDLGAVQLFPLNMQLDVDGVVRRVELLETGAKASQSFVTQLAVQWAKHSGLPYKANDQEFRVGNSRIKRLHNDFAKTSFHSWQALPFYSGTSRSLPSVSISELIAIPALAEQAAGRIILLGNMSESYAARYPTPLASNLLDDYGVLTQPEIIAEQLSTLLGVNTFGRTSYTSLGNEWVSIGLAIMAIVLAGVYLLAAIARGQLFVMLICSAAIFMAWIGGYLLGVLLPLVIPMVFVLTQYLAQAIATASVEYTNRRALGNMLSRHLSEQVAQELWRKRHKVSKEGVIPSAKTTATVLFADVVGFTRLSEQMEPEMLVSWLNRMLSEVTKSVTSNGGMVDKFIGDAVMAVFGVPDFAQNEKQLKKQVDNAIKATLTMRERLMALNGELAAKGLPAFQMRVGLHTGELIAGEIGSIDKSNYTVIGDTVNVAARIESKGSDYEAEGEPITIIVSDVTRELSTLDIQFDELGVQFVKGRAEPIGMFRVNAATGNVIKGIKGIAPNATQIEAAIGFMNAQDQSSGSAEAARPLAAVASNEAAVDVADEEDNDMATTIEGRPA